MQELTAPPPDVSAPPPPAPAPETATVFSGSRAEFIRLVTRGAILELFTLGFYRFWLTNDMRRHMWAHSSAGGDALEYTGTPKELLIGFLFALAILVPVYLIYFFIGLEAERLQAFASIPLVLFFYFFAQFAIYRARRYRLTRTIWRGIRFWMTGSGWAYSWRAGLWSLLALVTLGLALPWARAALERYKMRHSYYGDLPGRFDGTGWGFFKRGGWLWLLTMLTLVIIALIPEQMPLGAALMRHALLPAFALPIVAGTLGVVLVFASPFIYAAYKAIEWRWWASGIAFGEVRFESKLTVGALIGLYWKVIAWSTLILVGLSTWFSGVAGLAFAIGRPSSFDVGEVALMLQAPLVLLALAAGYVIAALAFGVVVRIYLRRDVWARIVSTTIVHNLAAAENVAARGEAAGSLGEGLADSLDAGGF